MVPARFLLLMLLLATSGCKLGQRRQEAKIIDPVLPTSITRDEIVDYLNSKTDGLQSWRCTRTQVEVKSPELPIRQKLTGTLACSTPGQFRLVCDNMVGHADFGSNQDICWAYVKPGESIVMTWKHEDSHLLQHLPGGMPRLEPDWLMTILGIQPLDAEHYELQNSPLGSRELWLVAVEDAADGTSLRRVIKVDTVTGVARLHALYDNEGQPLLMAHLSNHKKCGPHSLPHTVRIEFPATETQLSLNFTNIETGCQIADTLWQPPSGRSVDVVDLGNVVRNQLHHDPEFQRRQKQSPMPTPTLKTVADPRGDSFDGRVHARSVSDVRRDFSDEFPETLNDDRFYGSKTLGPDENRVAEFDASPGSLHATPPEFDSVRPSPSTRKKWPWPRSSK